MKILYIKNKREDVHTTILSSILRYTIIHSQNVHHIIGIIYYNHLLKLKGKRNSCDHIVVKEQNSSFNSDIEGNNKNNLAKPNAEKVNNVNENIILSVIEKINIRQIAKLEMTIHTTINVDKNDIKYFKNIPITDKLKIDNQ